LPGQVIDVPLYWHHWRNGGELLAALTAHLLRRAAASLVPISRG
jgi:LysR family transcriptional regulator (chromosome initiation inhibitor)